MHENLFLINFEYFFGGVYKILSVTEGQSHSVEHERQTELRVICRVPREGVADCVAMWSDPALLEPVMR